MPRLLYERHIDVRAKAPLIIINAQALLGPSLDLSPGQTSPAAFVHAVLKGVEDAELPYRQARRDVRYDGTCATHATHVDVTHALHALRTPHA